jgi:hypothetical protein
MTAVAIVANDFSLSAFPRACTGRIKASDKSGKRNAIQTAAQPEAKKPAANTPGGLQLRVKSANIRVVC